MRKTDTKLHPGPEWHIFHIPTSEDIDDVISYFCTLGNGKRALVYIIRRKITFKIWLLFSRDENNILLTRCARS